MTSHLSARILWRALPKFSNLPASSQTPRWTRSYATDQRSRTAIVTGSSRGIGKAIAIRMAHDGYDVCINDIQANKSGCDEVVKEIQKLGRKSFAYTADVSNLKEVQGLVKSSVEELGPLNTMVANAGIAQVKALLDLTPDDLSRMFQVNVYGVFNCYSTAAKQMISQGSGGKLLGAASVSYYRQWCTFSSSVSCTRHLLIFASQKIVAFKPFALLSHYSASKWAVRGMTQAFAMEMAEHKITVNAYAPGIVGTAMWDLIDEKLGEKTGAKKGDTIKKYTDELIALGRTSVPEDVASTVSFLSSKDSDYMTGQTIVIDGGIIFT
ncbi:hypothetical protein HBH70_169990 [Parastagonospora nodorum]|nr:hypothetical protein HBH94_244520 [Parastagonospora nodorum]KAH4438716.1 hypothetical protein HBH90_239470 [Parastagonospora nodorum]KAH4567055.1 hypothetical protein HBH83_239150 [Parastagonospora nodorum]KAH4736452.1 hypothetical protein HBH64_239800 [Parastagonospora nodorum]KAH4819239.1 hypothetical protein HBH60_192290 [Parastagonospora nodorum]